MTVPIKRGLTGLLVGQSRGALLDARNWNKEKNYDQEVARCVVSQMLMGIALESCANELGDSIFPENVWSKLERIDTKTKWWLISGQNGKQPFDYGLEPMQTVADIMRVRDQLVHPKVYDAGTELVLLLDGAYMRDVAPDMEMPSGATLASATRLLHQDKNFNVVATDILWRRGVRAIITVKQHTDSQLFGWAEQSMLMYEIMVKRDVDNGKA